MNTPTDQPSHYPTIEAWRSIEGHVSDPQPVNTNPEPLPRCSWCGGVASTDPCCSCRPIDAADTESGTAFAYVIGLFIVIAAIGVALCAKCA